MTKFVLTRDMVPIHLQTKDGYAATFVCPVPINYLELIKKIPFDVLHERVEQIIGDVNALASLLREPFQNMLLCYGDRDEQSQNDLLRTMTIKYWNFDTRGLYVVSIHGAEGDVYLTSNCSMKSDLCMRDIATEYFDHDYVFCCHNMDYYWQALLVREVLVRYFNLLMTLKESY